MNAREDERRSEARAAGRTLCHVKARELNESLLPLHSDSCQEAQIKRWSGFMPGDGTYVGCSLGY
jgi:hypothetical protein